MKKTIRSSISIDNSLLKQFEGSIKNKGYQNRSQAIADLIRKALVEEEWNTSTKEVIGAITLVYNHHQKNVVAKLTKLQHKFHQIILSTTHIHLDKDNCLEVLIVRGRAQQIRNTANQLTGLKGIKYSDLSTATTGKNLT